MYWVDMDGGKLNQLDWYPIKVFMTDSYGYDYIRIAYSIDSGPQSSLWKGNLTNLLPGKLTAELKFLSDMLIVDNRKYYCYFTLFHSML